jgi:putative membrane protein
VKGFLITLVVSAIAFVALLFLLPDQFIQMGGDIVPQLAVGAFIGLMNAVVKPIVKLFSLPITLMTLGLFSFVINAGMLLLSAWLLDTFFEVSLQIGGWPGGNFSLDTIIGAFVASIILSILTSVVGHFVHD